MSEETRPIRPSLTRYLDLRRTDPHLFHNPSSHGFMIVLDEESIREIEAQVAGRLMQFGHPTEWAEVGIVYEDQYLLILRDAVVFPDGERDTYIRILDKLGRAPGVAVLATFDRRVVLVRHFRHATRSWHLEIPRGFGGEGGSPQKDARREIEEEIGGSVRAIRSLGVMHPNTGLSAEEVHLLSAELESIGLPERHEAISELVEVSLPELERMIADGSITDSFTIAAYSRAKLLGMLD
ncbi:MAG: NUDIX hydrolase [Actinomycetota bacterium]